MDTALKRLATEAFDRLHAERLADPQQPHIWAAGVDLAYPPFPLTEGARWSGQPFVRIEDAP